MYADYNDKHGLECELRFSIKSVALIARHRSVWLIKTAWSGGDTYYQLVRPTRMAWGRKCKTAHGYVWRGGFCVATNVSPPTNPRTKKPWKLLLREPLVSVASRGRDWRKVQANMILACKALGEALG